MAKDKGFVAISDFHSISYPLDKVEDYYIYEYDKVYILGDATDRGNDGIGTGGVQLLERIMNLTNKYPGKVVYIPGNHDEFIIGYLNISNNFSDNYKGWLLSNGGKKTIEDLEYMKKNQPDRYKRLINWLGNLPIQKTDIYNGKNYVFAHALFNQKLYDLNPNYSLNDFINESDNSIKRMAEQTLWFRKGEDSYNPSHLPPFGSVMIIGHTVAHDIEGTFDLEDANGNIIKVHCVDGGVSRQGLMLKYVEGEEKTSVTYKGKHNPPKKDDELVCLKDNPDNTIKFSFGDNKNTNVVDDYSFSIKAESTCDNEENKVISEVFCNNRSIDFQIRIGLAELLPTWKWPNKLVIYRDFLKSIKEPALYTVGEPLREFMKHNFDSGGLRPGYSEAEKASAYESTRDLILNIAGDELYNKDVFCMYCDYVKKVAFDYIISFMAERDGVSTTMSTLDDFFIGSKETYSRIDDLTGQETHLSGIATKENYTLFTRQGYLRNLAGMLSKSGMKRVINLYGCSLPSEYIDKMLKKGGYTLGDAKSYTKKKI